MKVFIFSLQQGISEIISDHLSYKGHLCFTYSNRDDLKFALKTFKKVPDLLIIDYLAVNHDNFNLYRHFEDLHIPIPIVFYNDPCLTKPARAEHWINQIKKNQNRYIKFNPELYIQLFLDLEELIESEELRPYISLMQIPNELPKNLQKPAITLDYIKNTKKDSIGSFRERSNLQHNLFYLLTIFHNMKTKEITLNEIILYYKEDGKHMTEKSLKSLISQLRSKIRKDKLCNFYICNKHDVYRFVEFY